MTTQVQDYFSSVILFYSKCPRKYTSLLGWKTQLLRLLHMSLHIIVNKQKCFFWLCASSSAPELRLQLPDGPLIWRSHTGQPQQSQVTRAKLITPPKLPKMHPRRGTRRMAFWPLLFAKRATWSLDPASKPFTTRAAAARLNSFRCVMLFFSFDKSSNLNLLEKNFNAAVIELLKMWRPRVCLDIARPFWASWQRMRLFSTAGPIISATCFLSKPR